MSIYVFIYSYEHIFIHLYKHVYIHIYLLQVQILQVIYDTSFYKLIQQNGDLQRKIKIQVIMNNKIPKQDKATKWTFSLIIVIFSKHMGDLAEAVA